MLLTKNKKVKCCVKYHMYFLVDPVDAAAVKKTFLGLFILKKKKKQG